MRSFVIYLAVTGPAVADEAMTATAFQTHTESKIFDFAYDGEAPYGTELYLPNRQVIWVRSDGSYSHGKWFENRDQICFRYRNEAGMTCSAFHKDDRAMIVVPADMSSPVHKATPTSSLPANNCQEALS